jgi:hypothetical protein
MLMNLIANLGQAAGSRFIEKRALSANLVTRAALSGLRGLQAGTVTPARMQRFLQRAQQWLPGATVRAKQTAVNQVERPGVSLLSLTGTGSEGLTGLPADVAHAYQTTPLHRLPASSAVPTVLRQSGVGPTYDPATHQVMGAPRILGQPQVLFHELGHARNPANRIGSPSLEAMLNRTPRMQMAEEIGAWRRAQHLYRQFLTASATARANSARLPTLAQLTQSRRAPLETYRLGTLNEALLPPGKTPDRSGGLGLFAPTPRVPEDFPILTRKLRAGLEQTGWGAHA